MLELRRYSDFSLFKRDVLPFLEQHEGENNLPLGVIMNMKPEQKPVYMGTVNKDGKLALVLLQTHPRQLILSKSLPFATEEIEEIAKKLYESYPNIPGMIGEKMAGDGARGKDRQASAPPCPYSDETADLCTEKSEKACLQTRCAASGANERYGNAVPMVYPVL
ncbi:hypothetical protein V2P11_00425 [Parageobacillus toebii]|uniref:hypothetical protein n=1 Tax=Parageobacillus toebii TaxID=153151 RepID=UPI002E1C8BEB|nr:hypothetical protein [Parageobacillus toebii]